MYGAPQVPTVDVDSLPRELPAGLVLLDVREQPEWAAGHIAGARHVPISELPARLADVPADERLVVVCKVGARSAHATAWLLHQGRDAVNLGGGVLAWQHAGRALVTDAGTPGTVA
jgi:rhodanese-related sulfurtransferase